MAIHIETMLLLFALLGTALAAPLVPAEDAPRDDRSLQVGVAATGTFVAPIQVALSGVPHGYRLPVAVRNSLVNCLSQPLQGTLNSAFGLRDVAWAGGILPCAAGGMSSSGLGAYNSWMNGYDSWNQCAQETPQWGSTGDGGWNPAAAQGSVIGGGAGAWGATGAWAGEGQWAGGGCPPEYGFGLKYGAGELRSMCTNQLGTIDNCRCMVYRCKNNMPMPSRWCGLEGYQPGTGQAWEMAWDRLGTCTRPLPAMNYNGIGCVGDGHNTISVPLRIAVNVPGNLRESAITYIISALQNNLGNVMDCFRSQDLENLAGVNLIVAPYGENQLIDETAEPTPKPTRSPTPRPTGNPTPRPTDRPTERPTPRPTTRRPTRRPVTAPPDEVTQVIPMQFNLDDIAPGYVPSPGDQENILGIIEDVIRENLDPNLDLLDVDYSDEANIVYNTRDSPSYGYTPLGGRRLENSLYLPVDVTVRGREDIIDMALPNILDIAEEFKEEIADRLKDYDYDAFKDVEVGYEAKDVYDVDSPTIVTNHPIQLYFKNVDVGYELSERDRDSVVRYMKDLLRDHAGFDWDILQVTHAGRFEMDTTTPHLPTRVTVRGPAEISDREALSYVLTILRDRKNQLANHLKDLDQGAFRNVILSIESRDLPDIEVPTFVKDPIRVTEHHVQLFVDDICSGYEDRFDSHTENRNSIIRFFRKLLRDNFPNLDGALEVVDVKYAGRLGYNSGRHSLPLVVTVRGPESLTDKISEYIEQILEDNDLYFKNFLDSLDRSAFQCATVDVDEYDEGSIIDSPSAVGYEETTHPVRINIKNAPSRWRLSDADRASVTRFVRNLLEDYLNPSFDVMDVAYATTSNDNYHDLLITVRGPRDVADFGLAYVMEVLNDHKQDIEDHIRDRKPGQLGDSYITLELYDPSSVTVYNPPSPTVIIGQPSAPVLMQTTDHNVQVDIENVPNGYQLTRSDRASVTRYVKEILEVNLDRTLELIEVSYAGNDGPLVEFDGAIAIPLRVSVQGPTTESDFIISYVMDILENGKPGLIDRLQSIDANAFKYVNVQFSTYDFVGVPAPAPGTGGTRLVETVHPMRLNIGNVPDGYRLTRDHKTRILSIVKSLLEDHLDDSFQLVNVALMSRGRRLREFSSSQELRRLDAVSLPLRITVRGPADLSDLAFSYVMDALRNRRIAILDSLERLDWDTFRSADVSFDTFDLDEYDDVDMSVGAPGGSPSGSSGSLAVRNTEHPVMLRFDNVPSGYVLSQDVLASILRFVERLLDDNVGYPLQLIDVRYAGDNRRGRALLSRRLDTIALPLSVTVRGPADRSESAILDTILQVFEDHEDELENYLQSLDWRAFSDVSISTASYDSSKIQETIHPVQLKIDNAPKNYRLSDDDRESIIRFVRERMKDSLHDSLDLVDVSYAGRRVRRERGRRVLQETLSIPLLVRVRHPSHLSGLALMHILAAIRDNIRDIELYLKTLDGDAFSNARVSADTYDLSQAKIMSGDDTTTPGWVWFLVAMSILLFICCCCICFVGGLYKYRKDSESRKVDEEATLKEDRSTSERVVTTEVVPYEQPPQTHLVPVQPNYFQYPAPLQIESGVQAPLQIEAGRESDAPRLGNGSQTRAAPQIMQARGSASNARSAAPLVVVPEDGTVDSTVITAYGEDPPSEHMSVDRPQLLALPPPGGQREPSMRALPAPPRDPSQYVDDDESYSSYSVGQPSYNQSYNQSHRQHELRSYSTKAPSAAGPGRYDWGDSDEESSATQPALLPKVPTLRANDPNVQSVVPHEYALGEDSDSQPRAIQQRSYNFEGHQSGASQSYLSLQEQQDAHAHEQSSSYVTQSPATAGVGSVNSSAARVSKKKKKKDKKSKSKGRRHRSIEQPGSGGSANVQPDTDDFYYGHSRTFYI